MNYLEELNISRSNIDIVILKNLPVRKLSLCGIKVGNKITNVLKNTFLKYLDLSDNQISSQGFITISMYLVTSGSIVDLNLSYNNPDNVGIGRLFESLTYNTTLEKLTLQHCGLTSFSIISLADSLSYNNTLQILDLSKNSLENTGVVSLSEALANNSSLISIDFSFNHIGNRGIRELSAALIDKKIKYLSLIGNDFDDDGASSLASLLRQNNTLEYLNICCNLVNTAGLYDIFSSLSTNRSLATLNINSNGMISPKDMPTYCLSSLFVGWNKDDFLTYNTVEVLSISGPLNLLKIKNNSVLKILDLRGTGFSDLTSILECKSITSLNLANNQIDENGASIIASCNNLKTINLSNNKIGDNGALSLISSPSLTKVNIEFNHITCKGIVKLASKLELNETITSINLSGNAIHNEGADALEQMLHINSCLEELYISRAFIYDITIVPHRLKVLDVSFNPLIDAKKLIGSATNINLSGTTINLDNLNELYKHASIINLSDLNI